MKKHISICFYVIVMLLALTGCTTPDARDEAKLETKKLESQINKHEQEIQELKEEHELSIQYLKEEKDAYLKLIGEITKYLDEAQLLELAKSEWRYNIEVNGKPIPPNGEIEIDRNDFEVVFSEEQSTFPSLPSEIHRQGAISGEYGEHLLIKDVEPKDIRRIDGTVITAFVYVFENLTSNTSLKLEISDELKERIGLKTNIINIKIK